MKCGIVVLIFAGCFHTPLWAEDSGSVENEIRALETQRFHAMENGDAETLNRILSDDLIYMHADGLRQSKFDVIGVLGNDLKYESIAPSDVQVRTYSDAAVVAGRASIRIKAHGERQSFEICYLDVYVKQEGRWQMVAWQSSRLPAGSAGAAGKPSWSNLHFTQP